ncbi:MAG: hypothetical protein INH41_02295 [Myxococcaceae bacterium]|nr:hypothetical protein [Myxococcaceae bacterium]
MLAAGLLEPSLQRTLTREKQRLEKVLRAGSAGPGAAVLSPEATRKVEARIAQLDKLLTAGLLEPSREQRLTRERSQLERLLRAS